MASIRITCPDCAKALRLSARPPAGKKLKCAACGALFVPSFDDEEEATGIQESPKVQTKAAHRDEDEDTPPRRQSRRDDDDYDDDVSIKKKKRKRAKAGSGRMLLMIGLAVVLGGGALLSCGACGIGAFLWPGFLLPKTDMTAFLPPDANIVMGGNPKVLRSKMPNLERAVRQHAAVANQRPEMEDVTFNSERMLVFGNSGVVDFKDTLVSVYQSTVGDIAKVKRNPQVGPAQTIGGQANVHRVTDEGKRNGLGAFIAFPGGNIIVTANGSE